MGPHPDWTRHTLSGTALPAVNAPLDGLLITDNCIINPAVSLLRQEFLLVGNTFVSVFFLVHSFVDRRDLTIVLHFLIE